MGNEIVSSEGIVGFGTGSTWGTGVTVDTRLRTTTQRPNTQRNVLGTVGHDSRKRKKAKLAEENVTYDLTCPLTFGGHWLDLYGLFAGTESVRTEQTASQGDDLQTIDISDNNSAFATMAWDAESDVVEELPSYMVTQANFQGAHNALGSVSFSGIASEHINTAGSATNADTDLDALTYGQTEEDVVFNGTNVYFRVGDYSTGTALDSSNDLVAQQFSISVAKPVQPRFGMRGASTHKTLLPKDSGIVEVLFNFTLESIDDAGMDLLAKYNAVTDLMAEIFVDGAQIGTGVNTSLKFQLPALRATQPGERGYAGQATMTRPTFALTAFVPAAAPAGMSGVTELLRLTTIDSRA